MTPPKVIFCRVVLYVLTLALIVVLVSVRIHVSTVIWPNTTHHPRLMMLVLIAIGYPIVLLSICWALVQLVKGAEL